MIGVVEIDGKQVILGDKTFKIVPKSLEDPLNDDDLVRKSWVDALIIAIEPEYCFYIYSLGPSTTATEYVAIEASRFYATAQQQPVFTATELHHSVRVPRDISVVRADIAVLNAPGAGNQWDFTLRDDGADTAVTVNISDTDTSGEWEGAVTIAKDSFVNWKSVPTSTPNATTTFYAFLFWKKI